MPIKTRRLPRLRQLYNENRSLFLSFLFSALIISAAFFSRAVFPFGDRNILTIDLYHQYAPFMVELREKLVSFGSPFYTWNGGLGTNFWSLFAYYLASPLNIILVLFPAGFVTEAIFLLVVGKLGLAATAFAAFLRGVHKIEGAVAVAFSTMYALSGYTIAYFWNLMWLDSLYLLPLVMLGLYQMIREKRFLLYTVSLALVIYTNYYMAFFVCLFTVLYYPVALFSATRQPRPGQLLATTVRFGLSSLLAGGLASVLLIPTYFSLRLTSAAGDTFPRDITHTFDLFDYIGQHFLLTPPSIRDGMPNMYSGLVVLILIPVFFLSRSISLRAKLWHLGLVFIMILSFNINALNFIWHGMHFPNQLPYRNSFVYIFLILSMAAPAFRGLREFSGKQLGAIGAYITLIILLSQKLNNKKPEQITLYVTLAFLVIYLAVLTANRILHLTPNEMAIAFLLVVLAELSLNSLLMMHRVDRTEYLSERNSYLSGREVTQIREQLAAIEEQDDSFYRTEILNPKTTNDSFLYSFRGLSIFASTVPTKPVKVFENLGYHSNSINSYKYEASTILLDSIFNIRYLIHREQKIDDRLHEQIAATDELIVYRNPYAASVGYWAPNSIDKWNSYAGSPFDAQNSLLSSITDEPENVLETLEAEAGDSQNLTFRGDPYQNFSFNRTNIDNESIARVNILNEIDQQIYLYIDIPANVADFGYVSVGDRRIDFNAKRATIIDLGHCLASEQVVLEVNYKSDSPESSYFDVYACALSADTMQRASEQLNSQALNITRFSDTLLEGTVSAPADGKIFLTIPYDQGWSATVDGEPVEIVSLDDGFLLFNISAGEHDIVLRFRPPMLLEGALISLASLIVVLLLVLRDRRREKIRIEAGYMPLRTRPVPQRVDGSEPEEEYLDYEYEQYDYVAEDKVRQEPAEPTEKADVFKPEVDLAEETAADIVDSSDLPDESDEQSRPTD